MKQYWKMELLVVLVVFTMCGAFLGIAYIQDLDGPQTKSASVRMVKKQRAEKPAVMPAEKPAMEDGFDVKGRVNTSIDNE